MTDDERLERDGKIAKERDAELVDLGALSRDRIREQIAKYRAQGLNVVGCSFCATHSPRSGPMPCPFCDTMIAPKGAP